MCFIGFFYIFRSLFCEIQPEMIEWELDARVLQLLFARLCWYSRGKKETSLVLVYSPDYFLPRDEGEIYFLGLKTF